MWKFRLLVQYHYRKSLGWIHGYNFYELNTGLGHFTNWFALCGCFTVQLTAFFFFFFFPPPPPPPPPLSTASLMNRRVISVVLGKVYSLVRVVISAVFWQGFERL